MADDDISFDWGKLLKKKKAEPEKASKNEVEVVEEKVEDLKKEHPKPAISQEKKSSDVSINFSSILGKLRKNKTATGGEDAGLDFSRIFSWSRKNWMVMLTVLLLLTPILLSWSIRVQPRDIPLADIFAGNSLNEFIKNDIANAAQFKYPNLPQQNKQRLIDEEFSKAIRGDTYTIQIGQFQGQTINLEQQKEQTAAQFREFFQYEANGKQYTYMPDIDPYTYLRYARNYLEKGDIADERRDGIPYDNHMVAPLGKKIDQDSGNHGKMLARIYRLLSIFNSKITLMQGATYFPLIFVTLSIIPVFFIGRRVAGNTAGFFAALIFAVNGALLGRTLWGHADTDAYNVFFPLFISWCFIEAYYQKKSWPRLALGAAAGMLTGFFALFWTGWWYIFNFVIAAGAAYLAYRLWSELWANRKRNKKLFDNFLKGEIGQHLAVVGAYLAVSAIFVSLFLGFGNFKGAILAPFDFLSIKEAAKIDLFPNVYTTVAELNEASMSQIIGQMGVAGFIPIPFFIIAAIGILMLALPMKNWHLFDAGIFVAGLVYYVILTSSADSISQLTFLILFALPVAALIIRESFREVHGIDIKLAIFLTIWFVATMFASTKGVRFAMLLVPAFSIAFGAAIGLMGRAVSSWVGKVLNVGKSGQYALKGIISVVVLVLLITPVQTAYAHAQRDLPIVNDGWFNTLNGIKEASQPDAIITSWWDFGHHFKWFSERPVTFDGASQNRPMAHWVGKMLLTDDENLAVGILRMLDCGSNTAFEILDNEINDTSRTVAMIYDTVALDRTEADKYLKDAGVSEATIDGYLKNTHCEPPEAFVIASGDMIGKASVWAHFGSWDFNRADIWVFARNMQKQDAVKFIMKNNNFTKEEAEDIYAQISNINDEREANSWIAPWPNYDSNVLGCDRNGNLLGCDRGITIDLENNDAYIESGKGRSVPAVFVYPTEEGIGIRKYDNPELPLGITLVPISNGRFGIVLAREELSASMFTRMYFMNGHGLSHFKISNTQRDANNMNIYTYEVDWGGKERTAIEGIVPALEAEELPIETTENETVEEENQDDINNSSGIQ